MDKMPSLDGKKGLQPDARQQNKIIKALAGGDINVIFQENVTASQDDISSFIRKVQGGEVNEDTVDTNLIRGIASPFSGDEGHKRVLGALQNNRRMLDEFSKLLHEGVYKNSPAIAPERVVEDHVAEFTRTFPTPKSFDTKFIDGKTQELEERLKLNPTDQEAKIGMAVQKRIERNAPELKALLYGKRNEYWEQSKYALGRARNVRNPQ